MKTSTKKRPEYFGADLAYSDVVRLYRAIGRDYAGICARARALTSKRTGHLEKRIKEIREEVEFREIWSKLFSETGELKRFASVAEMAERTGLSQSAIRRRIAVGELNAVKGYRRTFVEHP